MKTIQKIAALLLVSMTTTGAMAQKAEGTVVDTNGNPVVNAVVSCTGGATVRTDNNGHFTIDNVENGTVIKVWHENYFTENKHYRGKPLSIHLIETTRPKYNNTTVLPTGNGNTEAKAGVANVEQKDFGAAPMTIENAMKGEIAGLQVTNKSGMTGEGAYFKLRGITSLIADNSPLVVINGIPYMPDTNESQIIGGYSRSIFQALNSRNIRNITVLKGSEAAIYGSLGANGVIMIETDQATSDNLDTRISFSAIYGFNWNSKRIPMMGAKDYKNYLEDMGLTYYDNMEMFFNDFTFLSDPDAHKAYLYKHDTNWQDEIFNGSSTKEMFFRIEGGDNIAKYNISLGYTGDDGTMIGTNTDRYSAQINSNVLVSKKLEINANVNAAYMTGNYQVQGFFNELNPMIAAYKRSPLLSPFAADMYGNLIGQYSDYHYGAITNDNLIVSNPVAIVNKLQNSNKQYDINMKVGAIYRPMKGLTVNANMGLYYNFNEEKEFIPGKDYNDIAPIFDRYGMAENSVREGTNHTLNIYGGLNANYKLDINPVHKLEFDAGAQMLMTSYEYDSSFGRNSNNDFYQTLGDAQALGRYFSGYNNKWNWLNIYANAAYTFNGIVRLGATVAADGASSIGEDANRFSIYPAADAVLMAKELPWLNDIYWIDRLDLYANYTITGNSRFSSKYGKHYYTSQPYQTIAGIIRATVPNTELKAERHNTLNVGAETSFLNNRIMVSAAYFNTRSENILIQGTHSPVLGTSPYFCNDGKISSSGWEAGLNLNPVSGKDFRWFVGATVATYSNEIKSLGNRNMMTNTLSDGSEIVSLVGKSPYSFYGYQTNGVIATTAEANSANTTNRNGIAYKAGDVRFIDQNNDGIINDADKVVIGSAKPDFFGSISTRLEYRNFALDAMFVYSVGNDIYNAMRRITESGSDFSNQSTSMCRRWSMEGQITDMPRASYGDAVGNNDFSDRWIEDGSYLKLRDITLSYTWSKPLWNFIQGGTVFVTGQNLICLTDYLGLDPETSYSYSPMMQGVDYGKSAAPRSVKFGINLTF